MITFSIIVGGLPPPPPTPPLLFRLFAPSLVFRFLAPDYSETDSSKFQLHTRETFRAMAKALSGLQTRAKALGPALRPHVVEHVHWDWMRILESSGGVAQHQLNELIKVLLTRGVTLAALDSYAFEWELGNTKASPSQFPFGQVQHRGRRLFQGLCWRNAQRRSCHECLMLGSFY